MKNIRFFAIGLLSLVTLAACSPANSAQPAKTASDFSDRFSLDPDDGASLQYVPGAASIPEIEKLKNLHPTTGFVLRTEDGQEVGGPKERSSYDDVVAAFGQPVSSTDSANPGDGVNVWATDNGDIMAVFHNNVLTDITFRLKGGDANHQSTSSISKSDTPKTALERLGKPYAIMRSERWTSYVYKDSNGDESNFSTQGDQIVNVMSAAETKRLKGITGLDKNQ
ncbi:MAG: hypothetical protein KHX87_00715 [Streptococcus parasanguinis]|uniref:Lipoprotein n=1 Tax=Streptococcus parasanguinis TaxID=1318 RepID=A0A943DFS5_STRPA|nr:hypothetical protein [Streptococcus parasanguinis]